MGQIVKVKSNEYITHDVLRIVFEKPDGYTFTPGQAADISINKSGWEEKLSCFTFTSLPEDKDLEFTIKVYPERKRLTNELQSVKPGDELILQSPFGDIQYKDKGIFLAGGAGITPFIAILKELQKKNKIDGSKLIFANKREEDIIDKEYFERILGDDFINILSEEEKQGYEHGYISNELIKKHQDANTQFYYLCGPPPMMEAVEKQLNQIGVKESQIVKEGF